LVFTDERYPRLRVTRSSDGTDALMGPMRGMANTKAAIEAVERSLGVRTCTQRLTIVPRANARACLLKDLGQCAAPCVAGADSGYDDVVSAAREALTRDPSPVIDIMSAAIAEFAEKLDFERAGELRDGVSAIVDGVSRAQRLRSLAGVRVVAARRNGHAFDIISVVHGVLTGSARVSEGVWAACARLRDEWDEAPPSALVEEREMIAHWLEAEGTRLVFIDGEWSSHIRGAGRHERWLSAPRSSRDSLGEFGR
jgi:DNA polymerase-3 subunit epsilon